MRVAKIISSFLKIQIFLTIIKRNVSRRLLVKKSRVRINKMSLIVLLRDSLIPKDSLSNKTIKDQEINLLNSETPKVSYAPKTEQ